MKRALFALAALAAISAPALADQALATAKNCMACHAVDKKLVGPSYKDVAAKYAGQKDAVDKLAVKIIKGGSGVWGPGAHAGQRASERRRGQEAGRLGAHPEVSRDSFPQDEGLREQAFFLPLR